MLEESDGSRSMCFSEDLVSLSFAARRLSIRRVKIESKIRGAPFGTFVSASLFLIDFRHELNKGSYASGNGLTLVFVCML